MKATQQQYDEMAAGLDYELRRMNLTRCAVCTRGDLWVLLTRWLNSLDQPIGYGTPRDWKLGGLDDSHIETMFKKYMREVDKVVA